MRTNHLTLVAAIAMTWLSSRPAAAIPVFARIYDKPCGTCHTVFPELNPAGETFRAKGLHGIPPAIKPLRVASELELPGTLPVALSFGFGEDVTHSRVTGKANTTVTHFNLSYLSLLAGAELGPHLAFLADYAPVYGNPRTGEVIENTNVGMAFFQAHADVGSWLFNLRTGVFELPVGTSPRVHRLSVQPYLLYSLTASSLLGRFPTQETLVLGSTQFGAQFSGLDQQTGLNWDIGLTNGSNNLADKHPTEDVFAHVGELWGAQRAGLFFYYSPDQVGFAHHDSGIRLGPDVQLYSRQATLRGQFLASYDSDPTGTGPDLWYYGAFLEAEYRIFPSLVSLIRGEYVWLPTFEYYAPKAATGRPGGVGPYASGSPGATEVQLRRELWQLTGGIQWLMLENLKLALETTYGENHEDFSHRTVGTWTATARISTAFWLLSPPGLEQLRGRL